MTERAAEAVTICPYEPADYDQVAELYTRINRELAPPHMRELFEQYIATAINGELKQLLEIFSEAKRNRFWVVVEGERIVGCFGIEAHDDASTELRRMYLDRAFRGTGLARTMLERAEAQARAFGFSKMILSTAEVQGAAIAFYRKSGYALVRTETAQATSTRTAGGGLTRYHFEKEL